MSVAADVMGSDVSRRQETTLLLAISIRGVEKQEKK
jgi:hypothetical protein